MMLKKKIFIGVGFVFVGLQFIQPTKNQKGDPSHKNFVSSFESSKRIQGLLSGACFDCHSDFTNYPWYTEVQPIGWFMADHVAEGKKELNFDEISSYPLKRQKSKFKAIAEQIETGQMPIKSYRWLHSSSNLSDVDRLLIISWATAMTDSLNVKLK